MTGREMREAIRDGKVPRAPIQELIGFELVEVAEGRTVFSCVPRREHYNPIGVVHGGIAMTLLDSAMGAAVHSTLGDGERYTTLETKVHLVRAITDETGEIRAAGGVVHRGGRTATADGRLVRASDGALLAHGTSTCLVLASG
jgi:uncharacterized protein (TIGR00369 family)